MTRSAKSRLDALERQASNKEDRPDSLGTAMGPARIAAIKQALDGTPPSTWPPRLFEPSAEAVAAARKQLEIARKAGLLDY